MINRFYYKCNITKENSQDIVGRKINNKGKFQDGKSK